MSEIEIIQRVFLILVASASLLLGIAVFIANKKSKTNFFYFLTSISIVLWVIFGSILYFNFADIYLVHFGKINLAAVAFWFVAVYAFIVNFPIEKKFSIFDVIFMTVGGLFSIISVSTDLIVENVYKNADEIIWQMGVFANFYYVYAVLTAVIIIYKLISKYRLEQKNNKTALLFFIAGISLVALFNIIFNVIVPLLLNNDAYYWLGDYSLIFILGLTAYAILKHGLFNIKVIATEIIVIILSLVLFVETFISQNLVEGIVSGVIWLLATFSGYQLIKSVKKEIQQAEDLRKLTKKLESTNKDLNEANEELKKLDKTKDEFISVASHELNTPLAAIEGYLSMILDEHMAKVDTKAKEYLKRAYQSSKRLAALIMDLLNVSRIEQGRIHLQYVETNMCELIEEVVNELEIKANQKKVGLKFACPAKEIPKTWVDQARIHEVITNLTGNAIKFTEKGDVVVSAQKKNDNVLIQVKDSGIGIAKEDLEKLFHKFSQVNREEYEKQGSGLGLYISKSYVELMNGKIWAESEGEGKGTTFFVELPLLKEKPFDPHEGEGAVIRSTPDQEVMKQVMQISEKHAIKQ